MQYLFHLPSYVWHGVCLSVFFCGNYVGHWVCLLFVGIMLGIGFVCLFVGWLGDLCLALHLSVICGNYVGNWVCLFAGWVTYVWKWLGYLEQAQLINCFSNIW